MEEFNALLWGFTLSTIGTAFGWILNQSTNMFIAKKEKNKLLKKLIYNLLETYNIYVRGDFKKLLDIVVEKVYSKMSDSGKEENSKDYLFDLYSNFIDDIINSHFATNLKKMESNYNKCIDELSTIDPISAYYLSDKTQLFEKLEKMKQGMKNLQVSQEKNDIDEETFKKIFFELKAISINQEILNLEKELKSLSKKINPFYWRKIQKTTKKIKANMMSNIDEELENIFQKLEKIS